MKKSVVKTTNNESRLMIILSTAQQSSCTVGRNISHPVQSDVNGEGLVGRFFFGGGGGKEGLGGRVVVVEIPLSLSALSIPAFSPSLSLFTPAMQNKNKAIAKTGFDTKSFLLSLLTMSRKAASFAMGIVVYSFK